MTPLDRREQRRLETRQRLLDAAEQVFSKMGYEAASVLDITEAADVSKRTFYLHFTDKDSLIEALALRSLEELRAQVERHEQMHEDHQEGFRDGLYWVVKTIFEYARQRPELMQIIFGWDGSFRLQALTRAFMARAWEENMTRKCTWRPGAPVPTNLVAHAIAGVTHQLLCWWHQTPNDYTPDEMAAMCVSILYDGIDVNFDPMIAIDHEQRREQDMAALS